VPGGDLHIPQVDTGVKHRRHERVAEHVRMCAADAYACRSGHVAQPAGRSVPVHPASAGVQQDRAAGPVTYCPVDGPADRGWQRHQDDLASLAADPQNPMAMFLAQVGDVGAGCLEDPQSEQAEHRHEGEIVGVRRFAGGGQHGLELQVRESKGR